MIDLIATDLDGTLLRSDGTVSERTRAALAAAEAAGLVVVFVTGRPPRWLDPIAESTGHLGVAVGANGAVIYDLRTEQVLRTDPLDTATALGVAADLRARFPRVDYAVEYVDGFAAEPEYLHDWTINPPRDRHGNPIPPPRTGPLDTIADRPLLKLLAKDHGLDVDEFLASAGSLIGARASITSSSPRGLLEIAAPGVTKATGLARVAAEHGIPAERIAAIGDMPNDVPMLEWAGTSYAVGNAHPAAQAAADAVVGTNDEDAVALVVEQALAERG
jgi:Cof subfamily protein (haloacid dehalogenase superfamily)